MVVLNKVILAKSQKLASWVIYEKNKNIMCKEEGREVFWVKRRKNYA